MLLLRTLFHAAAFAWCELLRRQYHPSHDGFTHYSLRARHHAARIERFLRAAA